jgi:hypothetical protein
MIAASRERTRVPTEQKFEGTPELGLCGLGEEKNLLPFSGIKPRFFSSAIHNVVVVQTKLLQVIADKRIIDKTGKLRIYNVTPRSVRVTGCHGKAVLHMPSVVCSLSYPASKPHAPYHNICGLPGSTIFSTLPHKR